MRVYYIDNNEKLVMKEMGTYFSRANYGTHLNYKHWQRCEEEMIPKPLRPITIEEFKFLDAI